MSDTPEVRLLDERGVEVRFLLHDAIDVDGITYYLVEAADDPEQVLVLKESGGELASVDGAELETVLALLDAAGDPEGGSD